MLLTLIFKGSFVATNYSSSRYVILGSSTLETRCGQAWPVVTRVLEPNLIGFWCVFLFSF